MPEELLVTGAVVERGRVAAEAGRLDRLLDGIARDVDADHVTVISGDGYRASIPFADLHSGGVLTLEESGWRLRVEDGRTHCWNVKGVARLDFTSGKADDDVSPDPPH